ncbi:MAG: DUF2252 domain-containing protein [Pseudomonadota bacterium]|nr:DUF2252 domain-containing protein [Pseudomonadota bacterium]
MTDEPRSPRERLEYGRSRREAAPLESHAEWSADPSRADPVRLIEEQNEDRVSWLVPVRRARMSASSFTFYRGSARIMAADLAQTPVSGIETQICGDAHLANFGNYASPERQLVFDINDFDETLPGPWEWDVKRLAASFILAGRFNGLGKMESRKLAQQTVRVYRKAMAKLAEMFVTDVWYSLVKADRIRDVAKDDELRADLEKFISKTMRKDSRHALRKLAEEVDGKFRLRSDPPLIVPLRDLPDAHDPDKYREMMLQSFKQYQADMPHHITHLLSKFRPVDFAFKVVGVGSVGTRCFILLLEGRDRSDPLFLQIKEANKSVLEEHLPPSRYRNPGRRVVEGQHLMQTVSDIFLGYTKGKVTGHDFYLRQLKDWKGSVNVEDASRDRLKLYARTRGATLARAHARSGDPVAIAGYLGTKKTFDRAIAGFAEKYADQAESDYAAFREQIDSGRLEAAEYGE